MINTLNIHNSILRDGTSQKDRNVDAIRPDYVAVEGRSLEELITEAQRLAKELQFFDADNNPTANWESFLIDDPIAFGENTLGGQKIQQKKWARQLIAYAENPDQFLADSEKTAKLSKPHVVLFVTFLKLLDHVKSQMNGLTEKHLDFYFKDRLGLTPKEAVPDVVNVLMELVENSEYLEVAKGTVLQAGEDASGNPLQYTTDENTVISKAQITQLKNVFVQKQVLTIADAHQNERNTTDRRFMEMLEMALGEPKPADPLPDFPTAEITDISSLHDALNQGDEDAFEYLGQKLFLTATEFNIIVTKQQEEKNGLAPDWQEVYDILDLAHKNKIREKRREQLKEIHEQEDFTALLQHVYGNPLPGDEFPLYQGRNVSLNFVFDDLNSTEVDQEKAKEYIDEELKIKVLDFRFIMLTSKNQNASEEENYKAYSLLEIADRQIRSVSLPSPSTEQLSDIYATPDAREFVFSQYDEEEESKRFKTLGNRIDSIADHSLKPSELGFALSSPILLLEEGTRKIDVLLDLGIREIEIDSLQTIFDEKEPFQTHLSGEKGWFAPEEVSFTFGDYVGEASDDSLEVSISGKTLTITSSVNFDIRDVGRYIVNSNQKIYEILVVKDDKKVTVKEVGLAEINHDEAKKYDSNQVYLNSLRIEILLREDSPSVVPFGAEVEPSFIQSENPSLVFTMNHILEEDAGEGIYRSAYEHLVGLGLQKAHINVDVTGMKNVVLQNDRNNIDAKKPFEPFGFEPSVGDSFYMANAEVCQKRIKDLRLEMEWVKAPESFKEHYENYWKIEEDNLTLAESFYTIKDNNAFKAAVFFHDKNSEVALSTTTENAEGNQVREATSLFENGGKISIANVPSRMKQTSPDYRYNQNAEIGMDEEEVLEWDRYFRLELDPVDFQQRTYNTLFARQALSIKPEIKALKIAPPYEPKLKKLRVGYSACTNIASDDQSSKNGDTLFHLHPFGFDRLDLSTTQSLVPHYDDEGTLYMGIDQLNLPQIVSVLFQMAEGSADPEVQRPQLNWSYLRNNEWIDLTVSDIVKDTTNGLVNTGIVKIKIPADATTGGTLMPAELHWIKISVLNNINGISDAIDIRSQVVSATLSSSNIDPVHFESPLAIDTIKSPLVPIAEIESIAQPFTSSKGRSAEKGNSLNKRISERLRHKNRALTMWDYEHMVLNEFPEVYKAKCITSEKQLGEVNVIVVPDIKGRLPFNPFAPKVAADTLFQIQKYLNAHAPSFADVKAVNPFYLQVSTECVVQFHPGFDERFYKAKLIEEIKRFMSPWAYGEDKDIHIGGSLHASVIINFIAERPYIDYVANLKLFQSEDGKEFTDVRSLNDGKSIVIPSRPEMIMVAAQLHEIYVVSEGNFDEDSFEGLNYMEISKDFIVE